MNYVLMLLLLLIFCVLCFRIDIKNRIIDEMIKNSPKYKYINREIEKIEAYYMLLAITMTVLMIVCINLK